MAGIGGIQRVWTKREIGELRRLYPNFYSREVAAVIGRTVAAVEQKAKKLCIARTSEFIERKWADECARLKPGSNKGKPHWAKGKTGVYANRKKPAGPATGCFKTGFMAQRGLEINPIGSLRLNNGWVEMKIADSSKCWEPFHKILWEDVHGKIPAGYCLFFIDGDHLNIEVGNLELISTAEAMRRVSLNNLPEPLGGAIRLLGQLKRRIRERNDRSTTR